jgi:hypothetical protein
VKTKNLLVFLLFLFSGCDGCETNFPVTISNRTDDPIDVYAAGENLGAVSPNSVQNFNVEALSEGGSSSQSWDYASVDFVFRNVNSGKVSKTFHRTLRENETETIEVEKSDFN